MLLFIGGFVGEYLFSKRKHTATGLAGPDSAKNHNSCVEATLGDYEPSRGLGRDGLSGVVNLADYNKHFVTFSGIGIWRKLRRSDASVRLKRKDVEAGKQN